MIGLTLQTVHIVQVDALLYLRSKGGLSVEVEHVAHGALLVVVEGAAFLGCHGKALGHAIGHRGHCTLN